MPRTRNPLCLRACFHPRTRAFARALLLSSLAAALVVDSLQCTPGREVPTPAARHPAPHMRLKLAPARLCHLEQAKAPPWGVSECNAWVCMDGCLLCSPADACAGRVHAHLVNACEHFIAIASMQVSVAGLEALAWRCAERRVHCEAVFLAPIRGTRTIAWQHHHVAK